MGKLKGLRIQAHLIVQVIAPPNYDYWSAADLTRTPPVAEPTSFADGGSLDNSADSPSYPDYQNNQIFSSDDFATLQAGLANASNGVFTQTLTTTANPWFGVQGNTTVKIVWVYLAMGPDWYADTPSGWVQPEVALALDYEIAVNNFPNYSTLTTNLSPVQINLLTSLTSWTVQSSSDTNAFTEYSTRQQVGDRHHVAELRLHASGPDR